MRRAAIRAALFGFALVDPISASRLLFILLLLAAARA